MTTTDGGQLRAWCVDACTRHAWRSLTKRRFSQKFNSTSGVFSAFVASVLPGDAYVYVFNGNLVRLEYVAKICCWEVWCVDRHMPSPRAQDIAPGTSGWAYSVVHNPQFDWVSVLNTITILCEVCLARASSRRCCVADRVRASRRRRPTKSLSTSSIYLPSIR